MKYLFVPGEVLISRRNSDYQGYISESWPNFSYRLTDGRDGSPNDTISANHPRLLTVNLRPKSDVASASDDDDLDFEHAVPRRWNKPGHESAGRRGDPDSCSVKTWRWGFDTKFTKQHETLSIKFPRSKSGGPFHSRPIRIAELEIFPLRFAPKIVVEQLRHRGKMFWQCRDRLFVSYIEHEGEVADDRVSNTANFQACLN